MKADVDRCEGMWKENQLRRMLSGEENTKDETKWAYKMREQ